MTDLEGESAIITGASSGIGRQTAKALACEGVNVSITAPETEETRLKNLAIELEADHGIETLVTTTDVSDETQVVSLVDESARTFEEINIVVSNAGIGNPGTIDEATTRQYRELMGVNVDGMYFVTRESLPYLRRSEGNLILVGSSSSQYPRPGSSIYAASKWWTRGFAHSISGTVGDDGVAVTLINPSITRTELIVEGKAPLKERYDPADALEPETVADAIRFAASQSPPNAVNQLNIYSRKRLSEY